VTDDTQNLDHAVTVSEVRAESEALFRSIGEGAIATDEFGHITRINPTALGILELTAEEALGQWFPRIIRILKPDGTPLPLIERPIVRMFLSGQAVSEKALYVTKNGHIVPVNITVSPIILDDRPVGAVQVFRNITAENEVDRMKSEFISLASHQLRTPLSTIQTYAHMMDENYMGDMSSDQRRALHTIITATDTMNELISMLLNIARIESGSIAVNSKRLNASSVVQDVNKQLSITAATKNITLLIQPPKQPVWLKADVLILKEILLNLIGNVTIKVTNRPSDVLFTVTDTGIGIPLQAQEKIFSKFFRAQNVIHKETTGTGLGLYVVKGLVSTLHGRVWFKSEENKGTTFYVSLPKVYDSTSGNG
jgi:PAS domain S-box-containing protein